MLTSAPCSGCPDALSVTVPVRSPSTIDLDGAVVLAAGVARTLGAAMHINRNEASEHADARVRMHCFGMNCKCKGVIASLRASDAGNIAEANLRYLITPLSEVRERDAHLRQLRTG